MKWGWVLACLLAGIVVWQWKSGRELVGELADARLEHKTAELERQKVDSLRELALDSLQNELNQAHGQLTVLRRENSQKVQELTRLLATSNVPDTVVMEVEGAIRGLHTEIFRCRRALSTCEVSDSIRFEQVASRDSTISEKEKLLDRYEDRLAKEVGGLRRRVEQGAAIYGIIRLIGDLLGAAK